MKAKTAVKFLLLSTERPSLLRIKSHYILSVYRLLYAVPSVSTSFDVVIQKVNQQIILI